MAGTDEPPRTNWVLEQQRAEYERNRAQIEAFGAWYERYVQKFQEWQERERQEEADRIKSDRQAALDQVVATWKPVLAELVTRLAPPSTLKALLRDITETT